MFRARIEKRIIFLTVVSSASSLTPFQLLGRQILPIQAELSLILLSQPSSSILIFKRNYLMPMQLPIMIYPPIQIISVIIIKGVDLVGPITNAIREIMETSVILIKTLILLSAVMSNTSILTKNICGRIVSIILVPRIIVVALMNLLVLFVHHRPVIRHVHPIIEEQDQISPTTAAEVTILQIIMLILVQHKQTLGMNSMKMKSLPLPTIMFHILILKSMRMIRLAAAVLKLLKRISEIIP